MHFIIYVCLAFDSIKVSEKGLLWYTMYVICSETRPNQQSCHSPLRSNVNMHN